LFFTGIAIIVIVVNAYIYIYHSVATLGRSSVLSPLRLIL
jgi:hypothetical protein